MLYVSEGTEKHNGPTHSGNIPFYSSKEPQVVPEVRSLFEDSHSILKQVNFGGLDFER